MGCVIVGLVSFIVLITVCAGSGWQVLQRSSYVFPLYISTYKGVYIYFNLTFLTFLHTKEFICISTLHFYIQRSSYKFQTLHSLHFYIQRSSYVFPLYIQRSSYVFRLFLKPSPGRVVSLPPARQNKEIFFCPSYRSQRLSGYLQKKVWTMNAAPPHGG